MPKYLETKVSGHALFFEINTNDEISDSILLGKPNKSVSFEEILRDVNVTIKSVFDSLENTGIEEIEFEYGIRLGVKAGIPIWVISEASGEANFSIKVKWKKSNAS